jgi:TPR repeat protein
MTVLPLVMQLKAQQPFAKRIRSAVGTTLGGAFVACLIGGVLYGIWSYQTWQYEWATACQPNHGELSKAEWLLGIRPVNDCRPWWARFIFRDYVRWNISDTSPSDDTTSLARQGDAEAQYKLGLTVQDDSEAALWFRKAADQGLALAQDNLGGMYASGRGVPQDDAEALRWYRKAADQGLALAQNNLGFMYANGRGVPQDYAKAVAWYRKGADQGLAEAENNLGGMYDTGRGVPHDDGEAVEFFRKAADQGLALAQANLAICYGTGQSVPKDLVQAYQWLTLAIPRFRAPEAQNQQNAITLRDLLATKMTPAQIAEAERLAREWKPQ